MRIADRQFSPKSWAVLLYLAVVSCMLYLGSWQLNRAALKVSMQAASEQANLAVAVPISSVSDLLAGAATYQRVNLVGQYDSRRQFLWDNRTHKGQAGFEVIIPMKLETGDWVLINRGWVAPGNSRADLPDVDLPSGTASTSISIDGVLSRPSKGFSSGDAIPVKGEWPRLLQFFDYTAIAGVLGEPVLPVVVQVQALAISGKEATVYTPRPEWLTANWQPAASGPAKHYSYAFQWFAMAVALTLIFIFVNTHKRESESVDLNNSNH
ncbi:SURF1 family protein [Granulosicoccus sp.]|nr:SURF1 family protein [Granulosicoccus sp.]MDB4222464.1 SURF1 family protein [Granulosicoccus sp.]